jgi:hypothetical protein
VTDALTGRYTQTVTTDTAFDPQPTYRQLGKDAEVLNAVGIAVSGLDYEFLVSATAISEAELGQKNLSLAMKDATGAIVQELRIIGSTPIQAFGTYLMFKIFGKSVAR